MSLQAQEALTTANKEFDNITATLKKELQNFELVKVCTVVRSADDRLMPHYTRSRTCRLF